LRAGDAYHIESGMVEQAAHRLALGHRLYNSETGELASTHLQTFAGPAKSGAKTHAIDWEEESSAPDIDFARPGVWSTTARCIVRADDLDHTGRLDLCPLIHHTSDANVQFQNMLGMTSSYMRDKRIGFATFGYRIRIHELPRELGTIMRTDTQLAQLGRSSLWFAHRVVDGLTGRPIADVAQLGVHFDRVGRAAATIPDAIRARAASLLAPERAPAEPSPESLSSK
jgi:acyl-CoA thioesterase FadM